MENSEYPKGIIKVPITKIEVKKKGKYLREVIIHEETPSGYDKELK